MERKPSPKLAPLHLVYGAIVRARAALYRSGLFSSTKIALPVLCVGNATVGGSGKTPFVEYLAEELLTRGRKPVVLSRGYGGSSPGPILVNKKSTPEEVGDEACLYFKKFKDRVPMVIARDRVAGARFIQTRNLGELILLDDGMQHFALARDANILLLDATDQKSIARWALGKLLPVGYLREPVTDALKRSTCIVFTRKSEQEVSPDPRDIIVSRTPRFTFQFKATELVDAFTNESVDPQSLKPRQVYALTGIGEPQHFFDMVLSTGLEIRKQKIFPDHHLFTPADWVHIKQSATMASLNPIMLCTEKDLVKLRKFVTFPKELYFLRLKGDFISGEERAEFWELIESLLPPPAKQPISPEEALSNPPAASPVEPSVKH
ncbi:MAG: tetraacyldisaccharide 4'-kinase [Bdellovibrionota bacterium]